MKLRPDYVPWWAMVLIVTLLYVYIYLTAKAPHVAP